MNNYDRNHNYDDVTRQRRISRDTDYENYYPYPAMDDHYRMYRNWNDNTHYQREDYEPRRNDSGRTGYMQYREDRNRIPVSAYGYRNVGDRSNYGHSGTADNYDPREYDRQGHMYGMGAGTYPNGRRDEEMHYDSSNDWNMRSRDQEHIAQRHFDSDTDHNYDRDRGMYGRRDERYDHRIPSGRVHHDVGMNERNTSTWLGDHQGRYDWMDRDHYADRAEGRNTMRERDRSEQRGRW